MVHSEEEFQQTLRIIDASLNRIGEGLRFLEELARMLFNDSALTLKLKTLRHTVLVTDTSFQQKLLESRDADRDTGADMKVSGEAGEKELAALMAANSRRVQESLRTLEEIAKLPGLPPEMDTDKFRQVRFTVYTIEKELYSSLLRQGTRKRINGLYVIIDMQLLRGRSHTDVTVQAIRGGARIIQLRDKLQSKRQILQEARELKSICETHGVLFIVNDYADIALAVQADGLHLGQDDLPVEEARKILPQGMIIGCTTTSRQLAVAAQAAGADYAAVGAIFPTESKHSTTTPAKVVGLEMIREVKQAVSLPVVAIGGINKDNVAEVMAAGADSAAVIGAVLGSSSPEEASRMMIEAMERNK
jgi:thiamine-phosphate pyrophosphorylase